MVVKRKVYYFEKAGEQNTKYVIEAVKERAKQWDHDFKGCRRCRT